jgi:hypothetical protein
MCSDCANPKDGCRCEDWIEEDDANHQIVGKVKPYYEEAGITLYHGDCRQIMPGLGSSDVLLADPPWGASISVDGLRFTPKTDRSFWREADRSQVIKHARVIGDDEPFDPAHLLGFEARVRILWGAQFYSSRLPDSGGWWVWDKRGGERDVSDADWPLSEAELAWTDYGKGVRMFRHTWFGLIRDTEHGDHFHPTQKPVSLMHWCLNRVGATSVIDPYMGSGPTLEAAKKLGIGAIGIELEEYYCEIAANRLRQSVLNFEVPA